MKKITRKPYQPPRIDVVPLAPEEAVLTACKLGTGTARNTKCNKTQTGCTNRAAGS